jgi:bifunctional non-homologous end joining protein LigD
VQDNDDSGNIKSRKISNNIKPMLAKETSGAFDDKDWLFEIKWDGYRAITQKNKSSILLYSRNGLSFKETYPIVVDQLKLIKQDVILDGEIVVLNEEGKPDFQFLQQYSENQNRPIQYQVFDLLELNGKNTRGLELIERKELLKKIIPENEVIRYSDYIMANGKSFFEVTKEKNLEGIMAKKIDSLYFPGKRTADWLKIKHHKTQEAIIAGYTAPAGSRKYFGALILAFKEGAHFKYIGHTGTGFSVAGLKKMYNMLQPLVQKQSPFNEKVRTNSPLTWVKPHLICEVKYSEITADGKFRHPVFLHLREDKNINEVNMKSATPVKKRNTVLSKKKNKSSSEKEELITSKARTESAPKRGGTTSVSDKKNQTSGKEEKNEIDKTFTFGKNKVKVTNVNKIYFPEDRVSKGDVVNYYISMANYILPYLKGRPESLLRNPNGIHAKGFFHKDAGENVPSFVKTVQVHSDSNNKEIDYIICNNLATLVYLNNLGCIEINPWHSSLPELDNPDYLMIDIDPSDENTFDQVVEAALAVKQILDKAGADAYCKTSGASGLHIYVPTAKRYTFEQVKDFAYLVCMMVNDILPDFTTLERNLQKRGSKHIYMDYLQNRRGQTIASVYSLRPKVGATVSTPLLWKEVKKGLSPKQFTIHNIEARVKKMGDIFKGVLGKGIDLKKCLKRLSS